MVLESTEEEYHVGMDIGEIAMLLILLVLLSPGALMIYDKMKDKHDG